MSAPPSTVAPGTGRDNYLRGSGRGPVWGEPDEMAVRIVALVRVALAIGVGAAGSFLPESTLGSPALFLMVSLLWVPWSSAVFLATDRTESRFALIGGPLSDVLVLFAFEWFTPSLGNGALFAAAAVVAFATYTCGRRVGAVMACGSLLLHSIAQYHVPVEQRSSSYVVMFVAVSFVAIIGLVNRSTTIQVKTAERSTNLQNTSDAILSRVADAVILTDESGHLLQCNRAAEQIMGVTAAQAAQRSCSEMLGLFRGEAALDCSKGCQLLQSHGSDREAALGQEVWRLVDERRQPLLANAEAVTDSDGKVIEVVHSLRDITRIKEADEAKTLFLATTSHELKTPLVVITGFSELLMTTDLEPTARRQAVEAIHGRSVELSRIVERLLLSSQLESGHKTVALAAAEIPALIQERAHVIQSSTGRTISTQIPSDVPSVLTDVRAVTTIVDHLLENAVKYSPGGETVNLGVSFDDKAVRVEVADHGIGMNLEQVAHCFDKFWQGETTDVRRFGGTGIGLFIVQSLVESVGARIEVDSQVGVGTRFRVALPRLVPTTALETPAPSGSGERSMVREFMKQIGVPERSTP
ncbi:MAG: PAS domain-containing sensor histidine kinase [Acidimicrobiales bacterium]|nr:PAS domain-containing sensor histidine kinase [Acidimicrobiales bacterium]